METIRKFIVARKLSEKKLAADLRTDFFVSKETIRERICPEIFQNPKVYELWAINFLLVFSKLLSTSPSEHFVKRNFQKI